MRSDNLQLPYKFDSHQLIMFDRVIIFKMVIMVEMVKMVEMVIMVVMAMVHGHGHQALHVDLSHQSHHG